MIDCTGSMGHYNHTVRERCREISDKLKQNKILKNYDIKCERVFYRDPFDCMHDKHKYHPLGTVDELKYRMASIHSYGEGDITEDWLGTYNSALDKKIWRCRLKGHDIKIGIRKYSIFENSQVNIQILYFIIFHCLIERKVLNKHS